MVRVSLDLCFAILIVYQDFGDGENAAEEGSITASDLGYDYDLIATTSVASDVQSNAGQTLDF